MSNVSKETRQIDLLRTKEDYMLVQNISNLIDGLFLPLTLASHCGGAGGINSSFSNPPPGAELGLTLSSFSSGAEP